MTQVQEVLNGLQLLADKQAKALQPKPALTLQDQTGESRKGAILTFNKEFRDVLDMHSILDSTEVQRGDKTVTQNIYGNNRVLLMNNPDGKLILIITDKDELSGFKTVKVSKNGTANGAAAQKIHDTIRESYLNVDVFKPVEIFIDAQANVCRLMPQDEKVDAEVVEIIVEASELPTAINPADFQDKIDGEKIIPADYIPAELEKIADKENSVERINVTTIHEVPQIPSAETVD